MTSKADDDTLPLLGFSQDVSVDMTADEDFIPASQPQSTENTKTVIRNKSNSPNLKEKEDLQITQLSPSAIDATVPITSIIDQTQDKDKSCDFIPDTDTKKRKIEYSLEESTCRKKLQIDSSLVKLTEDIFETQWNMDVSKIPESPVQDRQNFLVVAESPLILDSTKLKNKVADIISPSMEGDSITEILVNDSTETVDLDASDNLPVLKDKKGVGGVINVVDTTSDAERCEEIAIFDNSVLLLDQQAASVQKGEKPQSTMSQKMYLEETIEDNLNCEPKHEESVSACSLPVVAKLSEELNMEESGSEGFEVAKQNGIWEECKRESVTEVNHSTPKDSTDTIDSSDGVSSSLETRKMEFKIAVSCMVTMNVKTKQILQKSILNVSEFVKQQAKPSIKEHTSDSNSDKSKRYSSSSSGSVYSDKMGLPFALPKRMSAISDCSDSSDDGFSKRFLQERKAFERIPWNNEYLLPVKIDELMRNLIENPDFLKKRNVQSPRKFGKRLRRNGTNQLEEILESSSSTHSSVNNLDVSESKISNKKIENLIQNEGNEFRKPEPVGLVKSVDPLGPKPNRGTEIAEENVISTEQKAEEGQMGEATNEEESEPLIVLSDGLPVFARWTDKRYYSGVLSGTPKNDRWDIKFDDGTVKSIREDFVLPTKWLKPGELVFALIDDKYVSGQIVNVKPGEDSTYDVELDEEKRKIEVKVSDLCLTEIMADIVKEKHKSLVSTPRARGLSHIDFDNVLSGKRHREQRTPLRPTPHTGNSASKKKSSSKTKKSNGVKGADGESKDREQIFGLSNENGHLVEDKSISTESPSSNDTGGTPGRTRGLKEKAKPRSLCYEEEDKCQKKTSDWISPDGTPIPGPSGVKSKKRGRRDNAKLPSVEEEKSTTPKRSHRTPDKNSAKKEKKNVKEKEVRAKIGAQKKARGRKG